MMILSVVVLLVQLFVLMRLHWALTTANEIVALMTDGQDTPIPAEVEVSERETSIANLRDVEYTIDRAFG